MAAILAVAHDELGQKARVVTVSSCANYLETLHWDTFYDSPQRREMSLDALYNQSKHVSLMCRCLTVMSFKYIISARAMLSSRVSLVDDMVTKASYPYP